MLFPATVPTGLNTDERIDESELAASWLQRRLTQTRGSCEAGIMLLRQRLWRGVKQPLRHQPCKGRVLKPSSALRCMARTWAGGVGSQCTRLSNARYGDLCLQHWRSAHLIGNVRVPVHGRVGKPIPRDKLSSFGQIASRMQPWLACDQCNQWHEVSMELARQYGGEAAFSCQDVGTRCQNLELDSHQRCHRPDRQHCRIPELD